MFTKSKKIRFYILWFFCDLLWFFKYSTKINKLIKNKTVFKNHVYLDQEVK
jgi:hypothetical protein